MPRRDRAEEEMETHDVIVAAGGILWRRGPEGLQCAIVFRRRYQGEPGLPKGKVQAGESFEGAVPSADPSAVGRDSGERRVRSRRTSRWGPYVRARRSGRGAGPAPASSFPALVQDPGNVGYAPGSL